MKIFESSYVRLFGAFNCTLTFHLLTKHLIADVKKHGSLVGHHAYSLEGTQGLLVNSLNGTVGFSNQMIRCKFRVFLLNQKIFFVYDYFNRRHFKWSFSFQSIPF
jgi:hypothetical protein